MIPGTSTICQKKNCEMKSPVDIVDGRIVDYDPRTQELIIKARYTDYHMMFKRQYKDCKVQLLDGRPLSDKQRKAVYALLREISDYTGQGLSPTKDEMKRKFMREELGDTSEDAFSLSKASMSLVCAFQRYLVRFMLDYDIPSRVPLLNYVDDVHDYLYSCLISRKCCICGQQADLHHEEAVGAGRDREEIIHAGMLDEAAHEASAHDIPDTPVLCAVQLFLRIPQAGQRGFSGLNGLTDFFAF